MPSNTPPPRDAAPNGADASRGLVSSPPPPPPATADGPRRVGFLRAPFARRTWAELLYGLTGLSLATAGFSVTVTLLCFGVSSAITFIGVFVLAITVVLGRWFGALYRGLFNGLLHERIQKPRDFRARRRGVLGWVFGRLSDPVGWRGLAHQVLNFPLSVLTFSFTVAFWTVTLAAPTYWIWRPFLPAQLGWDGKMHRGAALWNTSTSGYWIDTWPRILVTTLIGVAFVWLTPWIVHGFVAVERALGRGLLGPVSVSQRVRELEQTRSEAVNSSNEQLRRIERDLHDGTQARLVALAMNLGQAKEDLASDDPVAAERARSLIDGAHQQTKETLTELRDLARGIHPPILDNGLESALTSLGARSPIRVNLGIELTGRPSMSAETIAYFSIAELLTNAVKHSGAGTIGVRVRRRGDEIAFTVSDDGRGGAMLGGGTGLDGVQRRLATVDGTLEVDSPLGGPTTISGVLPFDA